jgi:hypothetical protein
MKRQQESKEEVPILDLNLSAFQHLHGNTPQLSIQGSRVVFLFNPDESFFQLTSRYNANELTPILDFVNAQRQLRAMMMSLKANKDATRA